jgi:hypothetical protein
MSGFTTRRPADIMRAMDRRIKRVGLAQVDMHMELVRGGEQDHAQLTSGRVPEAQLRAMGHPFGRTAGGARGVVKKSRKYGALSARAKSKGAVIRKGVLMPLPINRQTGMMRASYFKTAPSGKDRIVNMGFNAPYARYVLSPTGTRYMTARGFYSVGDSMAGLGEIARRHRARTAAIHAAYRRKATS